MRAFAGDAATSVHWTLELTPAAAEPPVPPSLLGHYDLSGALYRFDSVDGLSARMREAGFSEWRVGVGRWEIATQLLPTLTNGTPCPLGVVPASAVTAIG